MSKLIKYTLLLLSSIFFLTACDSNNSSENTNWESKIEDKINNKQKYIVIQQYIYDGSHKSDKTQKFIEEKSNFMYSKNYVLIQQTITSDRFGDINDAILTFEYKGD